VPKLEPQIEFSVVTSPRTSLQSTSTLPFAAQVRTSLEPLLASPASSAGVHEAEIEGTGSQSPMCFPVAMVNALATHTEPSAKLITAHKAHH